MKIIQFIQQWWLKLKLKRKTQKEAEHANRLKMISCTSINVMEFSGKLYVSYNGVPIVNVERLNINIPDLLEESRCNYLEWKSQFKHE